MRETLELLNEWWFSGNVSEQKAPPYKRKQFEPLWKEMEYRQMLILTGLRRVGKTTLMHQIIQGLLQRGVSPAHILYFSFDERTARILELLREYQKLTGVAWKEERVYLFLDEIHKLPGWSEQVKILYDALPNAKLFLSGSASVLLQRGAESDLAGRYFLKEIEVLSLREFAELYTGREIDRLELWRGELEALLPSYLRRPFPEIVRWEEEEKVREYIRELVIGKCLRDMAGIFGRVRIGMLNGLVELFMGSPGCLLNLTSLSEDLGVHKLTLQEHLFYLEFAKLIRVVRNLPFLGAESRKLKKIYPSNISLAFPFALRLDPGPVYETATASALGLEHYWRRGYAEVDFIRKNAEILPIEVTSSEEVPGEKIRRLSGFMKRYGLKTGVLVYGGRERRKEEVDGRTVELVPLLDLLLDFKL